MRRKGMNRSSHQQMYMAGIFWRLICPMYSKQQQKPQRLVSWSLGIYIKNDEHVEEAKLREGS